MVKGIGFKVFMFNDLYYFYGGNLDLLFEILDIEEVNVIYVKDVFDLMLSYYNMDIENFIEWVFDVDNVW